MTEYWFGAIVVATISWTVSSEEIFRPTRNWLGDRNRVLSLGVTCPYCVGVWVAFFFCAPLALRPRIDFAHIVMTFVILVGLSGFLTTVYGTMRQFMKYVKAKADYAESVTRLMVSRTPHSQLDSVEPPTYKERIESLSRF